MDPKITLLVVLISSIIGLSYLTEEKVSHVRRRLVALRLRTLTPLRRRS